MPAHRNDFAAGREMDDPTIAQQAQERSDDSSTSDDDAPPTRVGSTSSSASTRSAVILEDGPDSTTSAASSQTAFSYEDLATLPPGLRIVMACVGTSGDVYPHVTLGVWLKKRGHHVRVATHTAFKDYIERSGLEYAFLSGDTVKLMEVAVAKPLSETLTTDFPFHKAWVQQLCYDVWDACTMEFPLKGPRDYPAPHPHHDNTNVDCGIGAAFSNLDNQNYRADLILAAPVVWSAWHVAEALGVPICLYFEYPFLTPTDETPHPLSRFQIRRRGADRTYLDKLYNKLSWKFTNMFLNTVTGGLVSTFVRDTLRLDFDDNVMGMSRTPSYWHDWKTPQIYALSDEMMSRPKDWEDHVALVGAPMLEKDRNAPKVEYSNDGWHPSPEFSRGAVGTAEFGKPHTVYFGFGSVVLVHGKDKHHLQSLLTQTTRVLIEDHGVKVLYQDGWAGIELNDKELAIQQYVDDKMLELLPKRVPHDELFPTVSCAVHHGGMGTTHTCIRNGTPQVIVPFFGDHYLAGDCCIEHEIGSSVPFASATPQELVAAILAQLNERVAVNALEFAKLDASELSTRKSERFLGEQFGPLYNKVSRKMGDDWKKHPFKFYPRVRTWQDEVTLARIFKVGSALAVAAYAASVVM